MAQEIAKMKKDDLAAFLAKKLTKDQLVTLAQRVQDAGREAGGLDFAEAATTLPAESAVGVTPEDTTATLPTAAVVT